MDSEPDEERARAEDHAREVALELVAMAIVNALAADCDADAIYDKCVEVLGLWCGELTIHSEVVGQA